MTKADLIYRNYYIWVEDDPSGRFISYWLNPEEKNRCRSRSIDSSESIQSAIQIAKVRIDSTLERLAQKRSTVCGIPKTPRKAKKDLERIKEAAKDSQNIFTVPSRNCPRCNNSDVVRNGVVVGYDRYKCCVCGFRFSVEMKHLNHV